MEYLLTHPTENLKQISNQGLLDTSAKQLLTEPIIESDTIIQDNSLLFSDPFQFDCNFDVDLFVDNMFSTNNVDPADLLDELESDEDGTVHFASAAVAAAAASAVAAVESKKRKRVHFKPDPPTGSIARIISDRSVRALPMPFMAPSTIADLPVLSYAGGNVHNAWAVDVHGYPVVPSSWFVCSCDMVIGTELFLDEDEGAVVPYNMSEGAFIFTERFQGRVDYMFSTCTELADKYSQSVVARLSRTGQTNLQLFVYQAVNGREKVDNNGVFFVTAIASKMVLANQALCV